jgi:hypothetical protein
MAKKYSIRRFRVLVVRQDATVISTTVHGTFRDVCFYAARLLDQGAFNSVHAESPIHVGCDDKDWCGLATYTLGELKHEIE